MKEFLTKISIPINTKEYKEALEVALIRLSSLILMLVNAC
jgi:hypothetical protein